jgi:hypothetical protein
MVRLFYRLFALRMVERSYYMAVTGLHDLDEYMQAQLLLAVRSVHFSSNHFFLHVLLAGPEYHFAYIAARRNFYCQDIPRT